MKDDTISRDELYELLLDCYSIRATSLSFIDHSENILFQCLSDKGVYYSIRFFVFSPEVDFSFASDVHSENQIESMMEFVCSLHKKASGFLFHFPVPVQNNNGSFFSHYKGSFFSVMSWCKGVCLDGISYSPHRYYLVGQCLADFHLKAQSCSLKNNRPVYDNDYLKKLEELFVAKCIRNELPFDARKNVLKGFSILKSVMHSLTEKKETIRIIHGDMSPGNVIVGKSSFSLIDFSFVGTGSIYQDIGSFLFNVSSKEYLEEFCLGYESIFGQIERNHIHSFEILRMILYIVANINKRFDYSWISSDPYLWLDNLRNTT